MKQTSHALLRRRTVAIAVGSALLSLTAGTASADPALTVKLFRDSDVLFRDADMSRWTDNYLELGLSYNSKDSFKFGQYTGLTDKGGYANLGFNWLERDKANDAQYWRVYGSNLGLDSRKLMAEGGVQGRYDLSFSVDQQKMAITETASFIHQGLGTRTLTIPGYAGPGATANATSANITPLLHPFDVKLGRDIYKLGASGLLANNWDYKVTYREDRHDGTRLTGIPFSLPASQALIVPYQLDDKTQQIEATLAYAVKGAQLQFSYAYSRFTNDVDSLFVQNPYQAAGTNSNGRLSLMPSNDYHQLSATGAYNFGKTTRLTGKVSYSVGRQNDAFLPYSANVATGAAGNVPPRSSLDGKVVKTLLDLALTAKPIDKMNLKVAYQYRDTDNRTPIANYLYLSRDTNNAVGTTTTSRRNVPLDSTEQLASIEGDYEISAKTYLKAGLERKHVKYSLDEALYQNPGDRSYTNTDKLSLELRRPVSDEIVGSLGYTYAQRRGSEFDTNAYSRNSYWDPAFFTTNRLIAHPSVRQFMYADYDEDRVRASGNWTASEAVSLQASIDNFRQNSKGPNCNQVVDPSIPAALAAILPDTCLGRKMAEGTNVNLDLQWQPEENLTTFTFVSFGETGSEQAGRTWTRGAATTLVGNTAGDTSRDWSASLKNRDHTFGVGLKWQPEEKWDLGGTYVFNYGIGKASITTGPALAAETSMPNTWSKLHSVQLFAKWDYSKQLSWRFNYLYENLRSADWAYDNLTAQSISQVLLTGQQAPRYSNHVLGVSAILRSW